jgi:hypothetical protein
LISWPTGLHQSLIGESGASVDHDRRRHQPRAAFGCHTQAWAMAPHDFACGVGDKSRIEKLSIGAGYEASDS